jgi:hypothetical protein
MVTVSAKDSTRTAVHPDSVLFLTAVEHYIRHHVSEHGICPSCETRNCPIQAHAASVIPAAGVNPKRYDPPA